MTFPATVLDRAAALIAACDAKCASVAAAESCTGGLLGGALTAVPGSSAVVDRGFLTYSNTAKAEVLGIPPDLIEAHGAVSGEVARAMAEGVLNVCNVTLSAGITGIAGPGGGSPDKPVGLVHIAAARRGGPVLHARNVFEGDRDAVRMASVDAALALMQQALDG